MLYNYFAVAIGGAMGAMSRYGLGVWITSKWNQSFPLHTFIINIIGAFCLGFLNTLFIDRLTISPVLRLAIGVGFLGAFTTFSTFGYEVLILMKEGNVSTAVLYVIASVVVGIIGVFLGVGLARFL